MTYKALYRTWRPQNFKDIVGQQHITRTLQNALVNGRVAHAYLFCGPRGTGKTTTAKVLAKALNCLNEKDGEPCNDCENCLAVNEGSSVDVVEIDAASNRGIDEIRDLREKVKFTPSMGQRKVYIIDEVHMLTEQAFNALLKTLEEPPAHVVFVLATTEAHKVPVTILSRCQRFDFRRIKPEEMVERLKEVASGSGIEVEEEALALIARAAEGGLRDALSILDQAAAFTTKTVSPADIHSILGTVQQELLVQMTKFLAEGKTGDALHLIAQVSDQGKDLRLFTKELTSYQRERLLESIERGHQAALIDEATLYNLLQILVQAEQEMKWSTQPNLVLELAVVKASRPALAGSLGALATRVAELEKRLAGVNVAASNRTVERPVSEPVITPKPETRDRETRGIRAAKTIPNNEAKEQPTAPPVDAAGMEKVRQTWPALLKGLKEGGKMPLWTILSSGSPTIEVNGNTLTLYLDDEFDFKTADKPEYRKYFEWLLAKHLGGQWEVRCVHGKKPAKRKASNPKDDPIFQEAVRIFGADLVTLEDETKLN